MLFKLPSECILLNSIFKSLRLKYLPLDTEDVKAIILMFRHYLYNLSIIDNNDFTEIYKLIKNHTHNNHPENLVDAKSVHLYIEKILNKELKLYQTANNISGLIKTRIKINTDVIDYWTKDEQLELIQQDLEVLAQENNKISNVLSDFIIKNKVLIYKNKPENGFSKYKQISLDTFKNYIKSCIYIKLDKGNLIKFYFENPENNLEIFIIKHKEIYIKDNQIKFNKSVLTQQRLLHCLHNINRQEYKLNYTQQLIKNKKFISHTFDYLPDSITEELKLERNKVNFELIYLGITEANIEEVSSLLTKKLNKFNLFRNKVKDIQIKNKITGLHKITVTLKDKDIDLYGIYTDLNVTKKDINVLIHQKPLLIKYWIQNIYRNKIFYNPTKEYNPVEINYKELIDLFDNCLYVMPYTSSFGAGLYLIDNSLNDDNAFVFIFD